MFSSHEHASGTSNHRNIFGSEPQRIRVIRRCPPKIPERHFVKPSDLVVQPPSTNGICRSTKLASTSLDESLRLLDEHARRLEGPRADGVLLAPKLVIELIENSS